MSTPSSCPRGIPGDIGRDSHPKSTESGLSGRSQCPVANPQGHRGDCRGRWIALLDDDDEWLPRKLDIQLHTAQQSRLQDPIISCRLIKRSEAADTVLPWRLPGPGEPMSDYLFRRTGYFGGEGLVQTSTILTTKTLLEEVQFQAGLRKHVDIDWLLRAGVRKGTNVQFVAPTEPLVIWHRERQPETSSNRKDWRYSLSWIQQNRHLVTPGAYGSFLLTWLSANAVEERDIDRRSGHC